MHPVKQIYHCFGCGAGGDVFKFVMEMDKCDFMEAVRAVAEKCGIAIPQPRANVRRKSGAKSSSAHVRGIASRGGGVFCAATRDTPEGKAARGYLEDRGLDGEADRAFRLGLRAFGAATRCCGILRRRYRRN